MPKPGNDAIKPNRRTKSPWPSNIPRFLLEKRLQLHPKNGHTSTQLPLRSYADSYIF